MSQCLNVQIGQHSSAGIKPINQDSHGAQIPTLPLLQTKGVALAIADGISSSDVSQFASAAAVQSFISDYFCTSEAWSVKTAAKRVLTALNAWLYSQSINSQLSQDMNRGYVCTFSALILKSSTGYLFHSGDTRIYKLHADHLEQLTQDHRFQASQHQSYLTRALGMEQHVEFDYRSFPLQQGDVFLLATDGLYEYVDHADICNVLSECSQLDAAAQVLSALALERGSKDNITIQIVKVDSLPLADEKEAIEQLRQLPFPPELEPRMQFDGHEIIRKLHVSPRSHIFLARELESNQTVVLKAPSMELRESNSYLERFLLEEWIARRINSAHVLRPKSQTGTANYLYLSMEYVEGVTLRQWMQEHPKTKLKDVRNIIEQIARGLRAFHRHEMLHQDLKPENIMIDKDGTVKIIDFGSTHVAGLSEIESPIEHFHILGTAQYTAPEYFIGNAPSNASDIFSLAVIAYEMLTGRLPYGVEIIKTRSEKDQARLSLTPISYVKDATLVPKWVEDAIHKGLSISTRHRYQEIDEFMHDLKYPNKQFLNKNRPPLIERNPLKFWQGFSALLVLACLLLIYMNLTLLDM